MWFLKSAKGCYWIIVTELKQNGHNERGDLPLHSKNTNKSDKEAEGPLLIRSQIVMWNVRQMICLSGVIFLKLLHSWYRAQNLGHI